MKHSFALAFTLFSIAFAGASSAADLINVEVNKGKLVPLPGTASAVVIADPAIADIQIVSPRMVFLQGKAIGETSLYAIDGSDKTLLEATVEVTNNLSRLNRQMKEVFPKADVNFRTTNNGLVMDGYTDSLEEAQHVQSLAQGFLSEKQTLVNLVQSAGSDQVMLQVKIAEVARSELKRFGINLRDVLSPGNFAVTAVTGRSFLAAGALVRNGSDNSILGQWNTGGNHSVQGVIDALDQQGLVSVLAEPNLTTTSGKPANFLAGGEFPIPIVDGDGKVSVMYKPFGISLNFTPTVMSRDKISLNVSPEVSTISSVNELKIGGTSSFAIPSIQTRRASTTVELGSGQSFAIAGLLRNDRSNGGDKFPGLGDVPVLGALFRSDQFKNDQTELVILVTPYVVKPSSQPTALAAPTDGFTPPTDGERLLLGKLYKEQALDEDKEVMLKEVPDEKKLKEIFPDAPELKGRTGFLLE